MSLDILAAAGGDSRTWFFLSQHFAWFGGT